MCELYRARLISGVIAAAIVLLASDAARAQLPGLPGAVPQAGAGGKSTSATQEKTKSAVAAPSGPITVKKQVSDRAIHFFLEKFLPKYPGVRKIEVAVYDGVVGLRGRVDDDDSRDEITDVVKRVEGVRLVLNQMQTDEEIMTAYEFAARELGTIRDYFARKWLLIIVAIALVAVSALLGRFFAAHAETLLSPFIRNVLLRSVVGSFLSSLFIIGGALAALSALDLTQVVLSILGLSAVVGLAVGFAFRDITENFIASVLLGMRRPFQIGDYITVAGQSGVVKSLNTRATVLVTLEGRHVRIPNSVIFKEIMVNSTASATFRNSFDVTVPVEAGTRDAIDAITRALAEQKDVLRDPPPRVLVEALEPGVVRLRVYFWSATQGVDWFQLTSDAKLGAKLALQAAGILPGGAKASAVSGGPAEGHDIRSPVPPIILPDRVRSRLERATQTAESASPQNGSGRSAPLEHVLEQPETRVSEEGTNLLKDSKAE
jgi:small-conductance mechanosensitive channel